MLSLRWHGSGSSRRGHAGTQTAARIALAISRAKLDLEPKVLEVVEGRGPTGARLAQATGCLQMCPVNCEIGTRIAGAQFCLVCPSTTRLHLSLTLSELSDKLPMTPKLLGRCAGAVMAK